MGAGKTDKLREKCGLLRAAQRFGPARFNVVATQLWQFFEYPVRVEEAAAFAMPLLLITVLMFWLQRRILGRKGYASVTGKGGERRMIKLGPWRWVMLGHALLVCAISVLLPVMLLSRLRQRGALDDFDPSAEFKISAVLNRALANALGCERLLIQAGFSLPFGGSLLLVARRAVL